MSGPLAAYRGTPVLVLGASGFLGHWVARELTRLGARVVAGARVSDRLADAMDRWGIVADVRAFDALEPGGAESLIQSTRPAVVFNLVGYGVDRREVDHALHQQLNAVLPARLADTLRSSHAGDWQWQRLVHVGSALEYGLVDGVVTETTEPRPHTTYGRSKLAGTSRLAEVAQVRGCRCVTARVFTAFGAGEHEGRLLPTLRGAVRTGGPVRLSAGTQSRDFAYAEDVAAGLVRLGVAPATPGEVVNLATGVLRTVREFAETAARILGIPRDRLEFGADSVRPDEMRIAGVSVERLRALTGWLPDADLERTIGRAVRFADALEHQ